MNTVQNISQFIDTYIFICYISTWLGIPRCCLTKNLGLKFCEIFLSTYPLYLSLACQS